MELTRSRCQARAVPVHVVSAIEAGQILGSGNAACGSGIPVVEELASSLCSSRSLCRSNGRHCRVATGHSCWTAYGSSKFTNKTKPVTKQAPYKSNYCVPSEANYLSQVSHEASYCSNHVQGNYTVQAKVDEPSHFDYAKFG